MIGVTGILNSLPSTFPLESHENSGNMIHGDAPFQLFDEVYLAINRDWPGYTPGDRFKDFVNDQCSHVIITCANMFRANDFGENIRKRYVKLVQMLEGYNKPVILFGLGVQAKDQDISKIQFPPEAIEAMKAIATKATAVSVRGNFTLEVLQKFGAVENAFVTGCPSFFSKPSKFRTLKSNVDALKENSNLRIAYSGTHHSSIEEQNLFLRAIECNAYFIEPQNRSNYKFYSSLMNNRELALAPKHFERMLAEPSPTLKREILYSYFERRFRLFRDVKPWNEFNDEFVDFTFGTRFHVNMASILNAKPALWITHDARTAELAQALWLPSLSVQEASKMNHRQIVGATDYDNLFEHLDDMFARFNEFLNAAKLPNIQAPILS